MPTKNLIGQVFTKLTVLEKTEKRIDGKIVWKCQCECGNIAYVPTSRLTSGNTRSCGCLAHSSPKLKIGDKINLLTIIEPIPDRPHYYKCKCDCGNFTEVYEYNLKSNKVKSCGCLRRQASPQRLDLSNKKFGFLTALYIDEEKTTEMNRTYWLCQCECGNKVSVLRENLTSENRFPSCGCQTKSRGEIKITNLLKENNIQFETEKTFENCTNPTTNAPLRFDFYINNKYIIEFDGEQHYQTTNRGWGEPLEKIQYRDKIKNDWCEKNNIPLIRIPYWKLKTLTIEDLLLK